MHSLFHVALLFCFVCIDPCFISSDLTQFLTSRVLSRNPRMLSLFFPQGQNVVDWFITAERTRGEESGTQIVTFILKKKMMHQFQMMFIRRGGGENVHKGNETNYILVIKCVIFILFKHHHHDVPLSERWLVAVNLQFSPSHVSSKLCPAHFCMLSFHLHLCPTHTLFFLPPFLLVSFSVFCYIFWSG